MAEIPPLRQHLRAVLPGETAPAPDIDDPIPDGGDASLSAHEFAAVAEQHLRVPPGEIDLSEEDLF